jgi:hypothetical protein
MRKRPGPEATPLPAGLKRQKVVPPSHLKPMTVTKPRIPQSTSTSALFGRQQYQNQYEVGTPTPLAPCGLPRPPTNGVRAVSSSSIYMSKIPMQARIPSAPAPAPVRSHALLGKDATRRPKRESFKPRSSVMPGMSMGQAGSQWDLGEVDEGMEGDMEVF